MRRLSCSVDLKLPRLSRQRVNACVIAVPQQRTLWACQGPADRGNWVQLQFERA